jgi:hypothetical protein
MNWITRERPQIDRIASPWLIKKFVDENAVFYYVPFNEVTTTANELNAILLMSRMSSLRMLVSSVHLMPLLKNIKLMTQR